jgi:NAD(P)-dependent dehydrogenase (short-subunit alcohol dehydrogenase family)
VTVNAVAPAAIDGPMVATVAPERLEAMLKKNPVGRLADPRRSQQRSRTSRPTQPASSPARRSISTAGY